MDRPPAANDEACGASPWSAEAGTGDADRPDAWGGLEVYGKLRASALVESLKTANTTRVPALIKQLGSYGRWADSPLVGLLQSTTKTGNIFVPASPLLARRRHPGRLYL